MKLIILVVLIVLLGDAVFLAHLHRRLQRLEVIIDGVFSGGNKVEGK